MALTREIERGTMENLLAMPATAFEIMIGKVFPFIVVGLVQVTVVLTVAKLLFAVPFFGSLGLLLVAGVAGIVSGIAVLLPPHTCRAKSASRRRWTARPPTASGS